MRLRLVAYFLIACLALIFGLWVAGGNLRFSGNVGAEPGKAGAFRANVGDGKQRVPNQLDYARIDQRLQLLMERPAMVGLAVAIIENGEISFLKGYGETVHGGGEPVTTDTIFRWASLSKGVAGDMVALLAEQNRVSLFAPVNRYSASLHLPGGNQAVATVSDLLSHRLGIFAHANDSKLEDGQDPRFLRANLASLRNICPPGQCHAYQNVAFDAVSEIVERTTGQSYADTVRERLFLPLGMNSATMTRAGLVTARSWARPHVGGGNPRTVEVAEPYYRIPAAGGVNSSIKDLGAWVRAQMGTEPRVLSPAVLNAVQSPRANTPGENGRRRKYRERILSTSYGLGWRIFDYAGHRVIGHRGGVQGYRTLIMFDPARRAGVAAMWNSSTAQPGGLEYEVMDMLYRLPYRDWLELDSRPTPPGPLMEPTERIGNTVESSGP